VHCERVCSILSCDTPKDPLLRKQQILEKNLLLITAYVGLLRALRGELCVVGCLGGVEMLETFINPFSLL
jgi:hypothetical protein